MLQEVSIGIFKPTEFTLALLQPVFGEWINYLYAVNPVTKKEALVLTLIAAMMP